MIILLQNTKLELIEARQLNSDTFVGFYKQKLGLSKIYRVSQKKDSDV